VKQILLTVLLTGLAAVRAAAQPAPPGSIRVYVGTYTDTGESKGIYRFLLDPSTGALRPDGAPTESVSPSFLAFDKDGTRLFAVNETGDSPSDPAGGVSSFSVDPATGVLRPLDRVSSRGAAPCHLSLDGADGHVLVANYWGGSVAVFPVRADGRLGAATSYVEHRGAGPANRGAVAHAHAIQVDPSNRHALVADLGLDRLFVYAYDAARGVLGAHPGEVALARGAGPRHLTFDRDGRTVYVLNELNGTVTVFAYEAADGSLRELQTITTLPEGWKGENNSAELALSPDGRFLYASNRGPDDIAVFAVDPGTRRLRTVGRQATGGQHPRHFAIDPTGAFLLVANRDSNNLVVYRIDPETGRLRQAAGPVSVPRPVCLLMRGPR
jgi:6-phosphogluconolactonase